MTDDVLEDPWHDSISEAQDTFGAPPVLAVVSFVLSVLSLAGLGVLNGTTYTLPFASAGSPRGALVAGALLGALLALLPLVLGWRAASRVLAEDAAWVATLARSAILLALVSVVLRLVIAVVTATHTDPLGAFTRL